ncbi:hypothetical protein GLOIN_2v1764901 [Rhizophagus clarus]|uniref:Transposase domain-containing protein n=1 Tax=Rhizophagus clarus TaxID=94130 RepID=A0A8H3LQ40_9GLOM|nr:hypothetical protein GLOIN_2v1764901 [Rhizophagus clarus]
MDNYCCGICKRDFKTTKHDKTLWMMPIVNPSVAITQETNTPFSPSTPQANNIDIEMEVDYEELPQTEPQLLATFRETDCDPEDLQEVSLDNALDTIEGKNKSKHIAEWPSDAYWEFIELIVKGNISNKVGDKIIKFFNRHSNLEKSPLPKSTKDDKDYLNQISSPSIDFKEKSVTNYARQLEVADNLGVVKVLQDTESETRIYGEPYEYATIFDGIGKTSGHPVFLTLGNLPNQIRNSPESKVLLEFLPKIQDSGVKINMLEADDITATYKLACCKMPCYTCMVLREDLNKMDLECAISRTYENMQQVIRNNQEKDYSVHSTKNVNLNIYEACVSDRMHHIDLGLFKYQFEFMQKILKDVGGLDLLKVFNDHLRQIP